MCAPTLVARSRRAVRRGSGRARPPHRGATKYRRGRGGISHGTRGHRMRGGYRAPTTIALTTLTSTTPATTSHMNRRGATESSTRPVAKPPALKPATKRHGALPGQRVSANRSKAARTQRIRATASPVATMSPMLRFSSGVRLRARPCARSPMATLAVAGLGRTDGAAEVAEAERGRRQAACNQQSCATSANDPSGRPEGRTDNR
jgi:hypothetical protein